jgi:hypothetical protein
MSATFAAVSTTRIPLSDHRWIDVKDELSRGDRIKMWALSTSRDAQGNTFADPEKVPNAKPLVYLVGWSLGVPVTAEALNALTDDFGAELAQALAAHEEAQRKLPAPEPSKDGEGGPFASTGASASPTI